MSYSWKRLFMLDTRVAQDPQRTVLQNPQLSKEERSSVFGRRGPSESTPGRRRWGLWRHWRESPSPGPARAAGASFLPAL